MLLSVLKIIYHSFTYAFAVDSHVVGKSKNMELIVYASTCGFGLRMKLAQIEVVKSFKCFLHTSELQCHRRLDEAIHCMFMKYHEPPLSFVLTLCSLSKKNITDELVCALVRELQVNQSHQKLE